MTNIFKVLAKVALLIGLSVAPAYAQNTITVTTVENTIGASAVDASSFVRYRLRNYSGFVPQVSGVSIISQTQIDTPVVSGATSQVIYKNGVISPASTFYTIEHWTGGKMTSSANYLCSASGDISVACSLVLVPPVPSLPNDIFYLRVNGSNGPYAGSINSNSNNTFSGINNFTGAMVCKIFETTRCVDSFNTPSWSGSDVGAWMNAAATDVGSGKIHLAKGSYTWSTPLNQDLTNHIWFDGEGGLVAGATAPTSLTWTGAVTPISARSTNTFRWTNIQVLWNNPAFVSPVIDLSHTGTGCGGGGCDSAFTEIDHDYFGKSGSGGNVPVVISADKTITSKFHDINFNNYLVAIRGAVDNTSYSNTNQVYQNQFQHATATTCDVQNPVSGWHLHDDTIIGNASSGGEICYTNAAASANAISTNVESEWIGDYLAPCNATIFDIGGGSWSFKGNYINACTSGANTATLFSIRNAVKGISIAGNNLDNALNGIVFGTLVGNVDIGGNNWGGTLTNPITGTPASGLIIDSAGLTTTYGNSALNATANGVDILTLKRFTDTTPSGNFLNFKNAAAASLFQVDITGKIALEQGIPSIGIGTPLTVAAVNLVGQTASIGSTTLLASAPIGIYRINRYIASTVACGTPGPANLNTSVFWTSENSGSENAALNMNLGSLTTSSSTASSNLIFVNSVSNITYTATYTACTAGTATYNFRILLERLN